MAPQPRDTAASAQRRRLPSAADAGDGDAESISSPLVSRGNHIVFKLIIDASSDGRNRISDRNHKCAYSYVLYYTVVVIIKYVMYVVTAKTMATTCIYQMPNMEN